LFQKIAEYAQHLIGSIGYWGIFVLMILESTMVPIPSTLVMPFAGYLAQQGKLDHWGSPLLSLTVVILCNGIGAIVGSLACYVLGAAGGKPLLVRYGKYVLVREEDLKKTEKFFADHGQGTIFIARLLPVVRHFISIPAGIARMNVGKFTLQTFLGATVWGGGLAVFGYEVGQNWYSIAKYLKRADLIVGSLLILTVLILVIRWYRKRSKAKAGTLAAPAKPAEIDVAKSDG
jgi:membrane protein DedA with SNARE-associated domain